MTERAHAVVGLFASASALVDAVPAVRERNAGRLEAYTPYPVEELAETLGLRRSPLGAMVFVMAFLGAIASFGFQWWASAVDYATPTGGKALFSWQAFVPITFELMVLFATFTAGLGMLVLLCRLPLFAHPMLASAAIRRTTRDRFALAIEEPTDVAAAKEALLAAGATEIEIVPLPAEPPPVSPRLLLVIGGGIVLACVFAGFATYWGTKLLPILPPMVHIQEQPRLDPYEASGFFRDGHGMQKPPEGSVARGRIPYPFATQAEAATLPNPLPRTKERLEKGRSLFDIHCAVCHGRLGDGVSTLSAAYGAKPTNLGAQAIRDLSDGAIHHVIVRGKNAMPSYATVLGDEERWAVVHHVRVLGRASRAKDEDLR